MANTVPAMKSAVMATLRSLLPNGSKVPPESEIETRLTADSPIRIIESLGVQNGRRRYWAEYRQAMDRVESYEGIAGTIRELEERRYDLAVVSSLPKFHVQAGLSRIGLATQFKVIVAYHDTMTHKPNPEPVLRALGLLASRASSSLMVGDSPCDVFAAKNAGVGTVGATWGIFDTRDLEARKPDYLISTPLELIDIVSGLRS